MAKFCTKCGKELKDGKTCECEKEEKKETKKENKDKIKEENKTETTKQAQTTSSVVFDDLKDILIGIFKEPSTTVKKYSNDKNFIISLIFLGACALFSGIFVYCLYDAFIKLLVALGTLAGGLGSLLGLGSFGSTSGLYNISFVSIFFKIFFYVAFYLVTYAGMMTLMTNVIFKQNTNFKKILTVTGLSSGFMICGLLLGSMFVYAKVGLGFTFFVVGLVASIVNLVETSKEALEIDKDKVLYSVSASILAGLLVIFYILPRFF